MTRKPLYLGFMAASGLLLVTLISRTVDPSAYSGGRSRDEGQRARRNSSALAMVLGEFRTGLSDMMFIKTEHYLHAGVYYVPHHDPASAENISIETDEHQSELGIPDEAEDEHSGHPTLIPPAQQDFRGIVGRLHRQVAPWRDPDTPHVHTDGRELLPWFRMMTLSDPGYVRGYVTGSFWLQHEDPAVALEFVNEGLQHNPNDFQLYVTRGLLLTKEARKIDHGYVQDMSRDAKKLLQQALNDFLRAAEEMQRVRPDDVNEHGIGSNGWERYLESDAMMAAHMAVTLTDRLGNPQAAQTMAAYFLKMFPDSKHLQAAANAERANTE